MKKLWSRVLGSDLVSISIRLLPSKRPFQNACFFLCDIVDEPKKQAGDRW